MAKKRASLSGRGADILFGSGTGSTPAAPETPGGDTPAPELESDQQGTASGGDGSLIAYLRNVRLGIFGRTKQVVLENRQHWEGR